MLNTLHSIYLADKYNIVSDRILWAETVSANDTSNVDLEDAINGSSLKSDLSTLDYFVTKYTMWTSNGIIQVDIKPDDESNKKLRTYALTQKTEAPFIPIKYVQADITLSLTNNQSISDDIFVVLDIFKIPQTKVAELIDIAKSLVVSPDHIDIQTLGIEKYLIHTNELLKYTNELLKTLIKQTGVQTPNLQPVIPEFTGSIPQITQPQSGVCRRY